MQNTTLVIRVLRYYFRENGAEIFNTFIPDVEYVEQNNHKLLYM